MFKLSDRFTLKKRSYSWELIEKIPSEHHWSKTGFTDEQRWYPTLELTFRRIFEVEIKESGGDLSDLQDNLDEALQEVGRIAKNLEELWTTKLI